MRSRLEAAKNQGLEVKELEDLIELPESMFFVWKYFINLHNKRTSNGFGMNPLLYSDIYAYFQLINVQPEEWEIDTILKLDSVALDHFAKQQEKEQKKSKNTSKTKR